jgi:hypothetical protein
MRKRVRFQPKRKDHAALALTDPLQIAAFIEWWGLPDCPVFHHGCETCGFRLIREDILYWVLEDVPETKPE